MFFTSIFSLSVQLVSAAYKKKVVNIWDPKAANFFGFEEDFLGDTFKNV